MKIARNEHVTKNKGDIGLTKVIADLVEKGFSISIPIHEHLPYDLIADYENKLFKIQVKYRGKADNKTSVSFKCSTTHINSSGKSITNDYAITDFDLYAIYSPVLKLCYYVPNIGQRHIVISERQSQSYTQIYWYEDFLNPLISEYPQKRNPKYFDNFNPPALNNLVNGQRKVKNRPNHEQLKKEIEEFGYTGTGKKYGVSDNAIRKWLKNYNNETPL